MAAVYRWIARHVLNSESIIPHFAISRLTKDGRAAVLQDSGGLATCTVVIPTFNERDTLPSLVDGLMAIPGVRVLVVDDASPDGTGQLADALVNAFPGRVDVLHRAGRGGIGSAYVEGMQRALTHGTALVAQMDADLSHDVRYLPDLIAATAHADLAIGSRYVPGGGVSNWSFSRRLLSRFANRYVRLITGLPVKDGTGGYRCWRRETLIQLPLPKLVSNGYAFQVEMAWETFQRRLRITEVPIVFVERRQGRSKLNWFVVFESILLPWRLRGRRMWERP